MATAVIRSKITERIVFVFFISTSISHTGLCESPISSFVSSGRLLGWYSYYPRFHIPFLSSLSAWYDFLKNNRRNYWMFRGNSRGLIWGVGFLWSWGFCRWYRERNMGYTEYQDKHQVKSCPGDIRHSHVCCLRQNMDTFEMHLWPSHTSFELYFGLNVVAARVDTINEFNCP